MVALAEVNAVLEKSKRVEVPRCEHCAEGWAPGRTEDALGLARVFFSSSPGAFLVAEYFALFLTDKLPSSRPAMKCKSVSNFLEQAVCCSHAAKNEPFLS